MKTLLFFIVVWVIPVLTSMLSHSNSNEDRRAWRHFHTKRHLPMTRDSEVKKRSQPPRYKIKPVGSLIPALREDDIDDDEIVSVAIGPPLITPRYDKMRKKLPNLETSASNTVRFVAGEAPPNNNPITKLATNVVVDILTQLGKEFLTRHVSEDFVFGQYVGNAMSNLTRENKLELQHHILELIVQFQNLSKSPKKKPSLISQESILQVNIKPVKIKPFNYTKATEGTEQPETTTRSLEKIINDTDEWSILTNFGSN